MRAFLLIALASILLCSCGSYQYLTLSSSQLHQNDKKEFVWQNDTVKIVYNFHGKNGPINLVVYNKTDQPMFIKWKRSALIRDGHSISLFNKTVVFNGESDGSSLRIGHVNTTSSTFSGSFDLPEGTDFLPPHSDMNKNLLYVQDSGFSDIGFTSGVEKVAVADDFGVVSKVSKASYDEQSSPLQFRIYLTFGLGDITSPDFSLQHSFYAKEILQTHDDPETFPRYGQDGDKLVVKQAM